MRVILKGKLKALYYDPKETCGLPPAVVKSFRKFVGLAKGFDNERSILAIGGWQLRKWSDGTPYLKLNSQFRLFLTFETIEDERTTTLLKISDPH